MKLTTVGRVAVWTGGLTASTAAFLILLYFPLGAGASNGRYQAARTALMLLMPLFLWLSAFALNLILLPGASRDGGERLLIFGGNAVGTSVAAVAVGLFVWAYQAWNPLPPGFPYSARFAIAVTFMPAASLLVGLIVSFAWSLAAHWFHRVRKADGDTSDENRWRTLAAKHLAPRDLGRWTPHDW